MTSIILPFSPRVSVFDWEYAGPDSDQISVICVAQVEQRQLVVKRFCPQTNRRQADAGCVAVREFRATRLVYIRQLESAFVTSVVHGWLANSGHFLLNCRVNANGAFRSCLLVFDPQLTLVRTLYFGLTTFPTYCYSDGLFYLPGETENCIRLLRVPDLHAVSALDCSESGYRFVPQESKSPFQVSVSTNRILLCSFYTISRRVVLNAYSKEPFQLQAEMRLDFSPMRYVDSGSEIIWFEGGPQQQRVKIRYVSIDNGFFVSDQEDSLNLLVPSRFTVPWLGSIWLFASRRGRLHALECPNFDGGATGQGLPPSGIGGVMRGSVDCQLCTSIDLHRERRALFSPDLVRDLIGRIGVTADTGDSPVLVVYHSQLVDAQTIASVDAAVANNATAASPQQQQQQIRCESDDVWIDGSQG